MAEILKLSQQLINQIAAGEVIERPASVIKELIDNSIDANSTKITIRLEEGGLKLIEVSDNGIGIHKDNLALAFEPHTTSKIRSLEDLDKLITMGFRGEALSTIVSVSNLTAISKTEDEDSAYKINFTGITPNKLEKAAHGNGTTVRVENIFENIPARKKYLKTAETEYRKILEIVLQFFMIYPNIHWVFVKDGKELYNLPKTNDIPLISINRLQNVIKNDWIKNAFEIKSQGAGVSINGYVAHPSFNSDKVAAHYIFINKRPVWDSGVAKAIYEGYSRFIPMGRKVPFVLSIEIDPKLIDVNVHPRKEEVRFENPFRVYSQITSAVTTALQNGIKEEHSSVERHDQPIEYKPVSSPKPSAASHKLYDRPMLQFNSDKEIRFEKPNRFEVKESLEFSKQLLKQQDTFTPPQQSENHLIKNVFQIFNKYIVIEFEKELWTIDQHAAAERITFERLMKVYNGEKPNVQHTLVPIEIVIDEIEKSYLEENREFLEKFGFSYDVKDNVVEIKSYPAEFPNSSIEEVFKSLWEENSKGEDITRMHEDRIATMACHSSIRSGQSLTSIECRQLYKDLMKCETPYSCPHGRPAIWKQKLENIDTNFYRTY